MGSEDIREKSRLEYLLDLLNKRITSVKVKPENREKQEDEIYFKYKGRYTLQGYGIRKIHGEVHISLEEFEKLKAKAVEAGKEYEIARKNLVKISRKVDITYKKLQKVSK